MTEIQRTHWESCWLEHHECAVQRVKELERTVAQLENGVVEPTWLARLRSPGFCGEDTQTQGALTHTVTLKLHGPGPLHSHHNDEPPSR